MPPILFAGTSTLTTSITLLIYLIYKKQLTQLKNKKIIFHSLGISIFTGNSKTSKINTTMLLQTEILFKFLIFGALSLEKITLKKMAISDRQEQHKTRICQNGFYVAF
jgi:hypothetical protein